MAGSCRESKERHVGLGLAPSRGPADSPAGAYHHPRFPDSPLISGLVIPVVEGLGRPAIWGLACIIFMNLSRRISPMRWPLTLAVVVIFAVGMANVEAAAVIYIRELHGGIDPLSVTLDSVVNEYGVIELVREAATMVMLLAVGWLAGNNVYGRLGYFLAAFGVWDIGYYAWLRVYTGWPRTIFDIDILFLIPLPWWGPVIAPALIALLMIVIGAILAIRAERNSAFNPPAWSPALAVVGMLILLYAFMEPAIAALPSGPDEVFSLRPMTFNWPVYLFGYLVAALGSVRAVTS